MTDHSNDVAIVSWNEGGFWQADLFCGAAEWDQWDWEDGTPPDAHFTLKIGQTSGDAFARAREKWPGVDARDGYTLDEDEV